MSDPERLDPVAQAILNHLAHVPANKPVSPEQIARDIAKAQLQVKPMEKERAAKAWRRYFQAVKDQAFHLARIGEIDITRKGKKVAPEDLKSVSGIWRMRLPRGDEAAQD